MSLELAVRSDLPDYTFRQEIEGVVYTLSFRFNERMGAWIMDIADEDGNAVCMGVPIYSDTDLFTRFKHLEIPQGDFFCIDETSTQRTPDRETFGDELKMLYLESTE